MWKDPAGEPWGQWETCAQSYPSWRVREHGVGVLILWHCWPVFHPQAQQPVTRGLLQGLGGWRVGVARGEQAAGVGSQLQVSQYAEKHVICGHDSVTAAKASGNKRIRGGVKGCKYPCLLSFLFLASADHFWKSSLTVSHYNVLLPPHATLFRPTSCLSILREHFITDIVLCFNSVSGLATRKISDSGSLPVGVLDLCKNSMNPLECLCKKYCMQLRGVHRPYKTYWWSTG